MQQMIVEIPEQKIEFDLAAVVCVCEVDATRLSVMFTGGHEIILDGWDLKKWKDLRRQMLMQIQRHQISNGLVQPIR